jgi:hypothetical protein
MYGRNVPLIIATPMSKEAIMGTMMKSLFQRWWSLDATAETNLHESAPPMHASQEEGVEGLHDRHTDGQGCGTVSEDGNPARPWAHGLL